MNSLQKIQKQKNAFKELSDLTKTTIYMTSYPDSEITEQHMKDWRNWVLDVMVLVGDAFGFSYFRDYRQFITNKEFKHKSDEVYETANYLIDLRKFIKRLFNLK